MAKRQEGKHLLFHEMNRAFCVIKEDNGEDFFSRNLREEEKREGLKPIFPGWKDTIFTSV